METPTEYFDSLIEKAEAYAKTSVELAKLRILESTINIATQVATRLSVMAVVSLFALFLNLGIALMFGQMLGRVYLGFFVLAGFYLFLAVILYFFLHRWIKKPISNFIIAHILR